MTDKELADRLMRQQMNAQTHTASHISEIPTTTHVVVLLQDTMRYDSGYGNGESDSTLHYFNYVYFDSDEALEHWIIENAKAKFRVFKITPMKVELKTIVTVQLE